MRAIFLLVIVVGLTIFALQNVEPVLSLVFLGIRSPALPLSIWILVGLATGAVASLLISGMLAFSNYLSQTGNPTGRDSRNRDAVSPDRRTAYAPPPPPRKQELDPDFDRENSQTSYQTEYGTPAGYSARTFQQETPNPVGPEDYAQPQTAPATDDEDDWVSDGSKSGSGGSDDDWGDDRENRDRPQLNDVAGANPKDYDTKQEPKSKSWAGSVYSYGYRDPNLSGVGQTESVYDAEYRMIVPAPGTIAQPVDSEAPKNLGPEAEDDWGLDEDDVFEDDARPGGPIDLKK
ncbi:LapA family protein [Microcoleus sp. LEGE 07076]|uniref:LapA family protein n=1 Tax=Microcoleus sp. LEGE 07076 TaxID=915322 RepID=UPI001881B7D4|nr:LapA family protein [Microcoleus sp. LEGE 07076]MBE9188234.1 LapA family protein [Microcoleus sp. LEGE 07076]